MIVLRHRSLGNTDVAYRSDYENMIKIICISLGSMKNSVQIFTEKFSELIRPGVARRAVHSDLRSLYNKPSNLEILNLFYVSVSKVPFFTGAPSTEP
jgi:hypothetical protein